MTKEKMMVAYKEWRKQMEEFIDDGMAGSIDCGEKSVREDFTNHAGMEKEITFEEMLELEREYEGQ